MKSQAIFDKAAQILTSKGYTVSQMSVCQPDFVLVFSVEKNPAKKNVMPAAEYTATFDDAKWHEELSSNLL